MLTHWAEVNIFSVPSPTKLGSKCWNTEYPLELIKIWLLAREQRIFACVLMSELLSWGAQHPGWWGHRLGHLVFRWSTGPEKRKPDDALNCFGLCVWFLPCRNRKEDTAVESHLKSGLTFAFGLTLQVNAVSKRGRQWGRWFKNVDALILAYCPLLPFPLTNSNLCPGTGLKCHPPPEPAGRLWSPCMPPCIFHTMQLPHLVITYLGDY